MALRNDECPTTNDQTCLRTHGDSGRGEPNRRFGHCLIIRACALVIHNVGIKKEFVFLGKGKHASEFPDAN